VGVGVGVGVTVGVGVGVGVPPPELPAPPHAVRETITARIRTQMAGVRKSCLLGRCYFAYS
jgi:hypothetical protein